jgi:hypothetical protein
VREPCRAGVLLAPARSLLTVARIPRPRPSPRRVTNGCIMETNKGNILKPILWLEKISKQ